jgi:hypothetical protein
MRILTRYDEDLISTHTAFINNQRQSSLQSNDTELSSLSQTVDYCRSNKVNKLNSTKYFTFIDAAASRHSLGTPSQASTINLHSRYYERSSSRSLTD